MAYIPPAYNVVDVTWNGTAVYSSQAPYDASWYQGLECGYTPQSGSGISITLGSGDYTPQLGGSLTFTISCESGDQQTTSIEGVLTIDYGSIVTTINHYPLVDISGVLQSPLSVSGDIYYWSVTTVVGGDSFDTGVMSGLFSTDVTMLGDIVLPVGSLSSVIERGNRIHSNARITNISSLGFINIDPTIQAATLALGNITVSSSIVACVFEMPSTMAFKDEIRHSRGRVIFGYPKAPMFREIYEVSNMQSLDIPSYPEEANFPIRILSTRYDLNDQELRIGTLIHQTSHLSDISDISGINIWLRTPQGLEYRDKLKIIDYPGGNYTNNVTSARDFTPIHCVGKKQDNFFLDIEYRQTNQETKILREPEHFKVDIQPHFEERYGDYINLTDQIVGAIFKQGTILQSTSFEYVGQDFQSFEETPDQRNSAHSTDVKYFVSSYDYLTQIFCPVQEDTLKERVGVHAGKFVYFVSEYVDLSSGQIGGS